MKILNFIRELFRKFPFLLAGNTLLLVAQSLIGIVSIVTVAPIIDLLLNVDLQNASSITRQAAALMESVGLPATLGSFLAVFLAFQLLKNGFAIFARYCLLRTKYAVLRDLTIGTFEDFFNARWIEIVRDPRGWYCSARESHPQDILDAARHWNRCYRGYVRQDSVGRERTILMSYEDLIVRRSGAVNDLAKFLGLEFRASEEWLQNIRLVDNDGRQWQANSSYDKASGQAFAHEKIMSREPREYDILDKVPAFRWRTHLTQIEKFLISALTFPTRRRLNLRFGFDHEHAPEEI